MGKISKEQLEDIKKQLMKQIEGFPDDQKVSMEKQINSMNDDELEEFLIKNKLINSNGNNGEQQSPFRLIVEGKLPSHKIAENDLAIAVLEINPISKGHTIIIPKLPTKSKELPKEISGFAQILAAHLKKKLECKDIQLAVNEILGEAIVNLLPVYDDETFDSPRNKASDSELKELQEKLFLQPEVEVISEKPKEEPEPEKKPKKKRKTPINRLPKAPKRVP